MSEYTYSLIIDDATVYGPSILKGTRVGWSINPSGEDRSKYIVAHDLRTGEKYLWYIKERALGGREGKTFYDGRNVELAITSWLAKH